MIARISRDERSIVAVRAYLKSPRRNKRSGIFPGTLFVAEDRYRVRDESRMFATQLQMLSGSL